MLMGVEVYVAGPSASGFAFFLKGIAAGRPISETYNPFHLVMDWLGFMRYLQPQSSARCFKYFYRCPLQRSSPDFFSRENRDTEFTAARSLSSL
jgi:hypothetical protein